VDAVVVLVALLSWLSLEDNEAWDGDGGSLSGLAEGRAGGQPAHADGAVAVVEDIESLEWDGLLLAMAQHELLTAGEDGLGDVVGHGGALVDDDGHGGRVVDEVLGQSGKGLLDGVALDERLEGAGDDGGIRVGHAGLALLRWERDADTSWAVDALSALWCLGLAGLLWCWGGDDGGGERERRSDEGGGTHLDLGF